MAQLGVQQVFELALQQHKSGRLREAEQLYSQILTQQPEHVGSLHYLGVLMHQQRRHEEAIELIRRAIALGPDQPEPYNNLGLALRDADQLDQAIAAYRQAIALRPGYPIAFFNLGIALYFSGQVEEAINAYQMAMALKPNYLDAHSCLVYTMHFHPGFDAKAIYEEASRWYQIHAAPLASSIRPHDNDPDPERPLRIGYVSADFRTHPLAFNFLPLAISHDQERYRVICYSAVQRPDAVTDRLRSLAAEWREIVRLSDEQLADLIRQDKIDILIDLAEHTANNRLLVFARKPAPVQATCLCNIGTTGVRTIDYRVSDPYSDPPGTSQANYVEEIVRLPDCYFCHEIPRDSPAVNSLPALQAGYITFGSLNNFSKVSPAALSCWGEILAALPNSRLIVRCPSGSSQTRVRTIMAEREIAADRIEFLDRRLAPDEYLRLHHQMDIYLDPFPYSGHTTSLDALWMGIPMISLAGRTDTGRSGVFLLSNLNIPELLAQSEQEYVQKAVELARNLPRLAGYRSVLRGRMLQSPLLDTPRFARNMEAAYRTMWRRWCQASAGNVSGGSNLNSALPGKTQANDAISAFRQAVSDYPCDPQAHNNLAVALMGNRQLGEAEAALRKAIALDPNFADAHSNLGALLRKSGQIDDALAAYRRAIALNPSLPEPYFNLGSALKAQGRLDDAIAATRTAIRLNPQLHDAHCNLVYTLPFHPAYDARAIAQELRSWDQACAEPLRKLIHPHSNNASPDRRLRIGYLSPNFRGHCQSLFMLPLMSAHDHQQMEICCYADVGRPDVTTARLQEYAQLWRNIHGKSDEEVAALIREDRIDILVDLTMHMANNRLLVFARKPAPVQVCWLAYPGSTGLGTMDYRLSDPYLDPPGPESPATDESVYSEKTIRLPDTFWCYDPRVGREIPVSPSPAMDGGIVTFGCLNNFCKLNESTLVLWARVLGGVPRSRLLLLAPQGSVRQRILKHLVDCGIDPERIEFTIHQPRRVYLQLYQRIDIGLDTFPYNGHTTSLDALWMGVPVVTLVGQTPVSRAGWCQLSNLGLQELAAQTPDEFVRIATELAGDLPRLAGLRSTLRQRMEKSPLMDASKFARGIENAYRQMWHTWCEATSLAPQ